MSPPQPPPARDARYNRTSREAVARAAKMYHTNRDAGAALGMAAGSFGRLCRRFGIETPQVRQRRELREARERRQRRP